LTDGLGYAHAVRPWRMRAATALPARLGVRTLGLLDQSGPLPRERVKVSRRVVWGELAKSLLGT
jgi:farnesyl-diphosphate farnesyltransferase